MTTNNEFIIVVIYVDDMLTGSTTILIGDNFIKYLREVYGDVTQQTASSTHLGLQWTYTNNR